MVHPLLGAPHDFAASASNALHTPVASGSETVRHNPQRSVAMTDIGDIMAPLGATILGTRSLADAAQILEESDPAVVLNLSYRAVGLITRADLNAVQQQDPQGWAKRRCAGLARMEDHPVQRSTPIRELLVSWALDASRPLLVLDQDQPAGILLPERLSAWRREHQSIRAGRISPSGETR